MLTNLFSFNDPVVQAFLVAAGLVLLDWICGLLVGLKTGFQWSQIPRQLTTFVLPYLGGLVVMAVIAAVAEHYPGFIQGTGYVALVGSIVAVGVKALADIFTKLQVLIGSSPVAAPAPAAQQGP